MQKGANTPNHSARLQDVTNPFDIAIDVPFEETPRKIEKVKTENLPAPESLLCSASKSPELHKRQGFSNITDAKLIE